MRLGEHTIGLRRATVRTDENGREVTDRLGDPVVDTVDVKVRWCQLTPTARTSQYDEPANRSAPTMHGSDCLVPPPTEVDEDDVVIYPITGEVEDPDGTLHLDGPMWQIVGEPRRWEDSTELTLARAK